MNNNDVKTSVLNYLRSVFPQLPTPILLQVILDASQQAFPFCDQDESVISQVCVNKLLEIGASGAESSPIKQLLSPSTSSTLSGDPIHNEYTQVSSTSNMVSSKGLSSPYGDNPCPSTSYLPPTTSIDTQAVDKNDQRSMPNLAVLLSIPNLPSTSDNVGLKPPPLPSSNNHDQPSLLKRSSTTSKIRNLFSSFGLKDADTICAKNKNNSKTDASNSDWLFVVRKDKTINPNDEPTTEESTTKDLEFSISSSETICVQKEHMGLFNSKDISNPVSNEGTSETVNMISTSIRLADSVETSNPVSSEGICEFQKGDNILSGASAICDSMKVSEQIPRTKTPKRCSPNKGVSSAATIAHDSGFTDKSGSSRFEKSQTSKSTKSVQDRREPEAINISGTGIQKTTISSTVGNKSLSPPTVKAIITKSVPSTAEKEDDDFVWISPETTSTLASNEKNSETSGAIKNSSAAGSPTRIVNNGHQTASTSKDSSVSKESSEIFSASNYLLQLSKTTENKHKMKPGVHSSLNIPICINDVDDVAFTAKDDTEDDIDGLDGMVSQVMEMFPEANAAIVRYLLIDIKKENPEHFFSEVVRMFLEEPPNLGHKDSDRKHAKKHKEHSDELKEPNDQKTTMPSKENFLKGNNLVREDSTPSTSYVPLDTTVSSRKRKMDDISEEVPSKKKLNSDVIKGSNKTEEDMDDINSVVNCEVCLLLCDIHQLGQCCDGHLTCSKCIEKEIKGFFTNKDKNIKLQCQVDDCSSFLPLSEVCRIMPPLIADIIRDKIEEKNLATIENLDDVVKCPECGHVGEVAQHKEIHCANKDCRLSFCRFCKKSWNDCNHDNCTALISTYNKSDNFFESYPKFWSKIEVKTDKEFVCMDVTSKEYNSICDRFHHSVNKQIVSILRIQNTKLWQKYTLSRKHILDDFGIQKLNELHLFHGTDTKNIDRICLEGFDWRLSGTHGKAYGKGAYFAVNANYSDRYSPILPLGTPNVLKSSNLALYIGNGTKADTPSNERAASTSKDPDLSYRPTQPNHLNGTMFGMPPYFMPNSYKSIHGLQYMLVARVVCGRSTEGHNRLVRPPPDPTDAKNRLFNSVTDNLGKPSIYCIFDSAQSYPEYLIEYKSEQIDR